ALPPTDPPQTMFHQQLCLSAPQAFWFEDIIFAHDWVRLLPYDWDDATRMLHRIERLPSGGIARLTMRCPDPAGPSAEVIADVASPAALSDADEAALRAGLRRAFVLDEAFDDWWTLCAQEPNLASARERGQGRMLRSPTVFEDLVKTV